MRECSNVMAQREEFQPCSHEGPCSAQNCSCVKAKRPCEKFCSCPTTCSHKFKGWWVQSASSVCVMFVRPSVSLHSLPYHSCIGPGCRCNKSGCSNACPCKRAFRECDPDVCRCAAAETVEHYVAHLIHKQLHRGALRGVGEEAKPETTLPAQQMSIACLPIPDQLCSNVKLQTRAHKPIAIGRSGVHGWGAFACCNIERKDFIYEYTGELISQDEADRRGRIYDKLNCSFLFDLNNEWVVDATHKGNKIKFANHSQSPNCYAKVCRCMMGFSF